MNHSILSCLRFLPLISLLFIFNLPSCARKPEAVEHGIFAPSRLESVIGQDGVCSINFSDDITIWTFADTITGRWKSDKGRAEADKNDAAADGMISNSIAWSEKITDKNYKNIKLDFYKENGRTVQFIKNRKDENPLHHRLWALDGFRYGNKVYVYYLHVFIPDHTKFLEFDVLYTGLARWDIPPGWEPGGRMDFRRLGPLFVKGSPFFGAAVLMRDGYLYLAGHFKKSSVEFPLSFARVRVNDAENYKAYRYLSLNGEWIDDIKSAGAFFGDVSGECSLSYNEYLKEYIIIYSKIFTGDIISVRFKDFSKLAVARKETVCRVRKADARGMWPYSGKEIFSSGGSIFLIYIDPERYQPLLVELKY